MLDDLYKDNMGINMDIRRLFEESTTKIYSFNKDKYILGKSKFSFLTERLPGKWEQLLSSNYLVQQNNNKSIFVCISYAIENLNNNNKNKNSKLIIESIKKKICNFIEKFSRDPNIINKIVKTINSKNNNTETTLLELYQKELLNEKNNYKLIVSEEKLRNEIMEESYNGCIIDLIILSIIYNTNIIILNKRYYKDIKENYTLIGPEFGAFDNNILLFKSIVSSESKLFMYNIIKHYSKYVFKRNELPKKFISFISK